MDISLVLSILVSFYLPAVMHIVVLQGASSALHPPKITVKPQYPEYFEGEKVKFRCSGLKNRTVEEYRFFHNDGQQIHRMPPDPYREGSMAFNVQLTSTGNYTCDYWMKKDGTRVISASSDTISLHVTAAPVFPSLSLKPLGDWVNLECTVPPEAKDVKEFQYCGGRTCILSMMVNGSSHTHGINITEPKRYGGMPLPLCPTTCWEESSF
nr:PREDICTED: uncharacterized protein LOC100562370 isoform X1 [Anolis carolinensis]|eukprot:XP_008113558.1 PREDICTED: uncharacterized protein LOC100562370 isoform X1 [Anolis carolinensis]